MGIIVMANKNSVNVMTYQFFKSKLMYLIKLSKKNFILSLISIIKLEKFDYQKGGKLAKVASFR